MIKIRVISLLSYIPEIKSKSEFLSLSSKTIKHVCLPSAPSFQSLESYEKTAITMECWLAESGISRALPTKQQLSGTDEVEAACLSPIDLNS